MEYRNLKKSLKCLSLIGGHQPMPQRPVKFQRKIKKHIKFLFVPTGWGRKIVKKSGPFYKQKVQKEKKISEYFAISSKSILKITF